MTDTADIAPAKTAGIPAKIAEALCSGVKHQQYIAGKSNQEMADWLGMTLDSYERIRSDIAPAYPVIIRLCAFFGADFTAKVFAPLFHVVGLEAKQKQETPLADDLMNRLKPHIESYLKETVEGGK
mgnify:CR=1 FL=1